MPTYVLLLVLSTLLVLALRARRAGLAPGASTLEVSADGDGVRRRLADGREEHVRWDDVSEVDVFTTSVGPHGSAGGAVVLYGDETNGCVVPLDRLDESGLFAHLGRLPGLDPRAMIDAIGEAGTDAPDVDSHRNLRWFAPRSVARTTVCWLR